MPIIKKNDITPERPVIIVLYGTPASGKTSLATTAENPLLIDTDRGFDRAVQRCDTLTASRWEDIAAEYETMKSYKTVICDTAKSAIDDYLMSYAVQQDYKLAKNSLKRFAKMADDFKSFVNVLRSNGSDIVFICHDRETTEGDVIKHSPDCTGQSKELLLRIADQVGYISKVNGKRVITFEPTDNYVGKNVAQLPAIEIPDYTDSAFSSCMADIISKVRSSIQNKSEVQRRANEQLAEMREQLAAAMTDEDIVSLMEATKLLPKVMQVPFFSEMQKNLSGKGYTFDKGKKMFIKG